MITQLFIKSPKQSLLPPSLSRKRELKLRERSGENMDYFLVEESGDSETKDYFDPNRNKAAVVVVDDAEDAESCCSDSSDHRDAAQAAYRRDGRRMKTNRIDIAQSTFRPDDDEDQADSSSKVLNNVVIDHHEYHFGVANKKKKLENNVSESFIISSGVVNNNMDEITDDRLFWEACLANGYP